MAMLISIIVVVSLTVLAMRYQDRKWNQAVADSDAALDAVRDAPFKKHRRRMEDLGGDAMDSGRWLTHTEGLKLIFLPTVSEYTFLITERQLLEIVRRDRYEEVAVLMHEQVKKWHRNESITGFPKAEKPF